MANTDQLVTSIVKGIQEKKGKDISIINLSNIENAITEQLIICCGSSDTHLDSISESIIDEVKENLQERPWSSEGKTNKEWVLLDYSNVVVHIFKPETRQRYNLEGLWGDAKIINIKDDE